TLAQVELTFPSAEAAVAYADRQGLHYLLHNRHNHLDGNVQPIGRAKPTDAHSQSQSTARPWSLESEKRTPDREIICNDAQPGTNSSAGYARPEDVLCDRSLSKAEKRAVLQRGALDSYLTELTLSNADEVPDPWRFDEVVDALLDLDEADVPLIANRASKAVH